MKGNRTVNAIYTLAVGMAVAAVLLLSAPITRGSTQDLALVDLSTYAPPIRFNSPSAMTTQLPVIPLTKWEAFTIKFGEHDISSSPMLDPVVDSKYAMDVTLFSALDLANQLSNFLELRYNNGHIGRAFGTIAEHPLTRWHASPIRLEDLRLKFDFLLARSKPYLGIRIVIPFGS